MLEFSQSQLFLGGSVTGQTPQQGPGQPDRRHDETLRQMFEDAYPLIEPFFDPATGWGGHSLEHLAFRVLRDNFPALSSAQLHTIVVIAHRVFIERNPERNQHLKRPDEIRFVRPS